MNDSAGDVTLTVLDVGHGNSTVVRHGDRVAVIDAPRGDVLPEELRRHHLTRVDHLFLSHTDFDHIGGATALLSSPVISVAQLWFSPDSVKQSETFTDLATLARAQHDEGRLSVSTNLNTGAGAVRVSERVVVEVLHPDIELASHGPRTGRPGRAAVSGNTASAVLRVLVDDAPMVLLCADIDDAALQRLRQRDVDLRADVLVYPHHGGSGSRDNRTFARMLAKKVNPRKVVFSHGRNHWRNPLPDVVAGIREGAPEAHIACTQLSQHCRGGDGPFVGKHLSLSPAAGRSAGICCAGSMSFTWNANGMRVDAPSELAHRAFISAIASEALCRRNP